MAIFNSSKLVTQNRIHDYIYDPVFTVPTRKDFQKHAYTATVQSAQHGIAPIFPCMFSDLPNHPRNQPLIRKSPYQPALKGKWVDPALKQRYSTSLLPKAVDIRGTDRIKFFQIPVVQLSPDLLPMGETKFSQKFHYPSQAVIEKVSEGNVQKTNDVGIQTMYRDSCAQTIMYKPEDYVLMDCEEHEILLFNFLKEQMPAGEHEVEVIQRARKRRQWIAQLPDIVDEESLEKRRQILEAIERDEWAFREEEINDIQNIRLELLENMLQEILDYSADRIEQRLERISVRLEAEKNRKVNKMKRRTERELRRLERNYRGINMRYHKVNVIEEHANFGAGIYAPLLRHGIQARLKHEYIDTTPYIPKLADLSQYNTLPTWLPDAVEMANRDMKLKGRHLCIRETKWTEPVLKKLYEELINLRFTTHYECKLRVPIIQEAPLDTTGRLDSPCSETDIPIEDVLLIQSIIRGRAIQTIIFAGRDKCRELINELQYTHALTTENFEKVNQWRYDVKNQQRTVQLFKEREANLQETLVKLQGNVVGTLLDYLNKELMRLLDERKAHALAMIYERDRRDREAAEAGRRQTEERRRKEHDEIFKQIVKVNQDTVDLYLRDIITEGVEYVSEQKAHDYVTNIARKIDEGLDQPPTKTFLEKEERIADLICHFLIPEIDKIHTRELIQKKQSRNLKAVHDEIYNKFENMPQKSKDIEIPSMTSEYPSTPALVHDYDAEDEYEGNYKIKTVQDY